MSQLKSKASRIQSARARSKTKSKKSLKDEDLIVIDESKGLIFENEDALYLYFEKAIEKIEAEYVSRFRKEVDFSEPEQKKYETHLDDVLDQPDQIWKDESFASEFPIYYFIRRFEKEFEKATETPAEEFDYIAVCYMDQDEHVPTFVFSHFPSKDSDLSKHYRKTELVYDVILEEVRDASVDGDALGDGDELALGLFHSMMVVRIEKDIQQSDFANYSSLREECIEHPDEIWKKTDSEGHGLVTFIKEFPDESKTDLHYVAVTLEDPQSQVHTLLFSFPTTDTTLVDRYRQGENLQADEVVQESSH